MTLKENLCYYEGKNFFFSIQAIPVNAQYQVPLITCLNKNPLTVVTTFATKPSTSGAPTVEKHSLTGISNSASDSLTRATVKPIGVQKGSYGKPPSAPTLTQGKTLAMSVAESSPTQPGIAIAQMKKEPVKVSSHLAAVTNLNECLFLNNRVCFFSRC